MHINHKNMIQNKKRSYQALLLFFIDIITITHIAIHNKILLFFLLTNFIEKRNRKFNVSLLVYIHR